MEKHEIEWMNSFIKRLESNGVKTSYFNNKTNDEKMKMLEKIAPLYGIDLKLARKINKELKRRQWEDEHLDLVDTDKDPYYVEDMKSGKYKDKKDYCWKKHGVGLDEAEND